MVPEGNVNRTWCGIYRDVFPLGYTSSTFQNGMVVTHPRSRGELGPDEVGSKPPPFDNPVVYKACTFVTSTSVRISTWASTRPILSRLSSHPPPSCSVGITHPIAILSGKIRPAPFRAPTLTIICANKYYSAVLPPMGRIVYLCYFGPLSFYKLSVRPQSFSSQMHVPCWPFVTNEERKANGNEIQ